VEAFELKQLVKESIREVLRAERLNLCQVLIPAVSDKEMQEIQEKLGVPTDHAEAEFVNMTAWVKYGTLPQ
jgi:phosphoenolpyruvate-protein kinase (PTS system EI component)